MLTRIAILVAALTLASCGGSSSGSRQPTPDSTNDSTTTALLELQTSARPKTHHPWPGRWPAPGDAVLGASSTGSSDGDLPVWDIEGLPANTTVVAINLTQRRRKAFDTDANGDMQLVGVCGDEWLLRIGLVDDDTLTLDDIPDGVNLDEWLRTWPSRYLTLQPSDYPTTACASGYLEADDARLPWSAEFQPEANGWTTPIVSPELSLDSDLDITLYGDAFSYTGSCDPFVNLKVTALAGTDGQPRNAQDNKRVMTRVTATGIGRADGKLNVSTKVADADLTQDGTNPNWSLANGTTTIGEIDLDNLAGHWSLRMVPGLCIDSATTPAAYQVDRDETELEVGAWAEALSEWRTAVLNEGLGDPRSGMLGWLEINDGAPLTSPKEPLVLFMDQSANGYVAAWDQSTFTEFDINPSAHVLAQGTPVIERTLPDGAARPISLAPFLPRLALADRRASDRLLYALEFDASSAVSLTLKRVDKDGIELEEVASFVDLQPTGLRSNHARNRRSLSLSQGGVHITDVTQLLFDQPNNPLLYHQFDQGGRYQLSISGTLKPVAGPAIDLEQDIDFIVADTLVTPVLSVLPQMPILTETGGTPITVQSWPPLADADARLNWVHSDDDASCSETWAGQTDARGRWTATDSLPCTQLSEDVGEYRLDIELYQDDDGHISAASRSWASVVAEPERPGSDFKVRGRRGFDNMTEGCDGDCESQDNDRRNQLTWYRQNQISDYTVGDGHAFNAFHGGDILWIQDDHAAVVDGSTPEWPADIEHLDENACLLSSWEFNVMDAGSAPSNPEYRFLTCLTEGGPTPVNPVSDELGAFSRGYLYTSSQRYMVRVRESVGDVDAAGYWRFNDTYGGQHGVGELGDRKDELKVQYLGAVLENTDGSERHIAASASGFVLTGNENAAAQANDTRVRPPLVSGDPLLIFNGSDKHSVFWPTSLLPGDILDAPASTAVPFTGQVFPTTNMGLRVEVQAPGSSTYQEVANGQVNRIGFANVELDDVFDRAGVWRIRPTISRDDQTVISDGADNGDSMDTYENANPLLAQEDSYPVFVLPDNDDRHQPLTLDLRGSGQWLQPEDAFRLAVDLDDGLTLVKFHHVAFMDGWLLQQGSSTDNSLTLDLAELSQTFRTLDISSDDAVSHGDLIRLTLFVEAEDADGNTHYRHRTVTLNGERLYLD